MRQFKGYVQHRADKQVSVKILSYYYIIYVSIYIYAYMIVKCWITSLVWTCALIRIHNSFFLWRGGGGWGEREREKVKAMQS